MSTFCSLSHPGGTTLPFSALGLEEAKVPPGLCSQKSPDAMVSKLQPLPLLNEQRSEGNMGQAPRNGCRSMPLRWWPPACTHNSQLSLTRAAMSGNSGDRQVWKAMPPTSHDVPLTRVFQDQLFHTGPIES